MGERRQSPDPWKVLEALSMVYETYGERGRPLQMLTEICCSILDSYACTLTVIDSSDKQLEQVACASRDEKFRQSMLNREIRMGKLTDGDFISLDLVRSGQCVSRYGLQCDGQGVANPAIAQRYGFDSMLSHPVYSQGRLIGYFNHITERQDRFNKAERRLVAVFARQVAAAVEAAENISLRSRFERLSSIMGEMTEARAIESLLRLLLERGLELVGCTRGWISRLDFSSGQLQIVAHKGELPADRPLLLGQGITGKSLQDGRPIRVDDVCSPEWRDSYEQFWPDTRSELAVPIVIDNAEVRIRDVVGLARKPIGVFNAESVQVAAFSQAEQDLLASLASHAALLIDRLETDRKLSRLSAVQQQIVGKQDWDTIVEVMLNTIVETLGYDRVNVSLVDWEHNRIRTRYIRGLSDEDEREFKRLAVHDLDSADIQAKLVRHPRIEVPDLEDERFDPRIYHQFHHENLLRVFVPMIRSDNEIMGTVEAAYLRQYRSNIYEQDVQILKGFVDYTVRALEQRHRGLLELTCHEIRAPFVGIQGHVDNLQAFWTRWNPDIIGVKLNDILLDCEIGLQHVSELETMFGGAALPGKIERTLIFGDIIIKVVEQLRPLVKGEGLDPLKLSYDQISVPVIQPLYVDRVQLNAVVTNLITNAIKYREDDPAQFRIWITASETKEHYIVSFQDWGIGVPAELSQKIFQLGFRAPAAKRKRVLGSGLGLTLARDIMRNMGGNLRLSRMSKPTEFQLILPKTLEEAKNDTVRG